MDKDISALWAQIFDIVKKKADNAIGINVHMQNAVPESMTDTTFTITVPMAINKNMIRYRYKDYIESAIEQVTSKRLALNVYVKSDNPPIPPDPKSRERYGPPDRINPKYTFENFVIGASNEYATAAAISTTEKPGYVYNPLFLYGNSGLGKTHLMHAIGNRIHQNDPSANVIYVTSEVFTNEFISAVREGKGEEFRKKYRSADVFLVDDVQFLENKEATQDEFFHTFNELYALNKQIVLTSDRKPRDLVILDDRLRTRFSQGLTIDITVPNYETRVAILQKKASQHNKKIDIDVLGYIAERIKSNVRELEGILIKMISISEISHKPIDNELADYVLKSYLPKTGIVKITSDMIMEKVSTFYSITVQDLTGKVRTSNVALPRQVAMYLCHKLTDMNFTVIGKAFGNKDRTTVMHNVRKIESDLETNESLKSDIDNIIHDLQTQL
ncbi:MAG TPA: chromosomal replication initiator protein DnaA [Candidatus Ornithomonoglobus intestinigallinarum]|uniref:Chromosomal replication initiator protein DnaA n=1 Tax=Candidatus Ornithomonoglobus intestinigallinarum TaxID=2840894 RepID=A0A9D1H348_9FIRM|nr:chromosomal replication initiator protein DnaA [Candidatus Ornithomonoglobus intestinigallinarum]